MRLTDHEKSQPPKKCQICSKTFKTQTYLRKHIEGVHSEKFECEKCGNRFTGASRLKKHTDQKECERPNFSKHRGKKSKCKKCNKVVSSWYYLQKHKQLVHGKKGLWQQRKAEKNRCPICSEDLKEYSEMHKHLKVQHNYEKKIGFLGTKNGPPLTCFHCNEQFPSISKRSLMDHLIKEHFPSVKQIFECHICFTVLSSVRTLNDHVRKIHEKKFECKKCGFCFSDKKTMNYHISKKNCGKRLRFVENIGGEPEKEIVPFFMRGKKTFVFLNMS